MNRRTFIRRSAQAAAAITAAGQLPGVQGDASVWRLYTIREPRIGIAARQFDAPVPVHLTAEQIRMRIEEVASLFGHWPLWLDGSEV
jgi:hypothetical protein